MSIQEFLIHTNLPPPWQKTPPVSPWSRGRGGEMSIAHINTHRLVLRAGKMNQILCCDWLPKQARCYCPLRITFVPQEKTFRNPY